VDRRTWLRRHPDVAKSWLADTLTEPIVFAPDERGGFKFRAKAALDCEISGIVRASTLALSLGPRR